MAESDGAMESGDRLSIATDPILIPRYYRIAFESNFFILSLYIPLQRGYKQSVEYRMFKITRCRNVVKSCIKLSMVFILKHVLHCLQLE